MASTNISSDQIPRPVFASGVRLAVKVTPHGPANAVPVADPAVTHGPSNAGATGSGADAGWPESIRLESRSGPLSPAFIGVWQSLQPGGGPHRGPPLSF